MNINKAIILSFALSTTMYSMQIKAQCSQVLHKKAFDICYSNKNKTPIYVKYTAYKTLVDKNNFKRKHIRFKSDKKISKYFRAYNNDYLRTGYDKGHLAPNALFDYDKKIQRETFLLSNIAPQKPQLNRRLWNKLERFVRLQAKKYGKLEIATGVCGNVGTIKNGVVIPKWWYKIIEYPNGHRIGFLAPNTNHNMSKAKIKDFIVDIDRIERVCKVKVF